MHPTNAALARRAADKLDDKRRLVAYGHHKEETITDIAAEYEHVFRAVQDYVSAMMRESKQEQTEAYVRLVAVLQRPTLETKP